MATSYPDALCLATMMRLKFEIINTSRMKILHREPVNGRRANGWQILQ